MPTNRMPRYEGSETFLEFPNRAPGERKRKTGRLGLGQKINATMGLSTIFCGIYCLRGVADGAGSNSCLNVRCGFRIYCFPRPLLRALRAWMSTAMPEFRCQHSSKRIAVSCWDRPSKRGLQHIRDGQIISAKVRSTTSIMHFSLPRH